jgi:hypothetical protein
MITKNNELLFTVALSNFTQKALKVYYRKIVHRRNKFSQFVGECLYI